MCDVEKYIDLESFVDYFIVYELAQNTEMGHPKSLYMHKEENEKLKTGPVWDFDWATFNAKSTRIASLNYFWYKKLGKSEKFNDLLHYSLQSYKCSFENLYSYIDSLSAYIKKSNVQNIRLWPIEQIKAPIGDEELDFDSAIVMLKDAYAKRISTLSNAWD